MKHSDDTSAAARGDIDVAALNLRFQGGPPEAVVDWAVTQFGRSLCVASSMTDLVLPHMVSRALPGVKVIFLDTGFHFPQTLELRTRAAAALPITVIDVRPEPDLPADPTPYRTNPDACCHSRKVAPMRQELAKYAAWAVGTRRVDSPSRRGTQLVSLDPATERVKIAPLAGMTDQDVAHYIEHHHLPTHAFARLDGSTTIGCAPCTLLPREGVPFVRDDARWPGSPKTECGIHLR